MANELKDILILSFRNFLYASLSLCLVMINGTILTDPELSAIFCRGYMAPEYAMRGYLTDKADVYSFGIVALEIVSGKSNTNYRPKEEFVYLLDGVSFIHYIL